MDVADGGDQAGRGAGRRRGGGPRSGRVAGEAGEAGDDDDGEPSVEVAADPGGPALGDAGVRTEGFDQAVDAAGSPAMGLRSSRGDAVADPGRISAENGYTTSRDGRCLPFRQEARVQRDSEHSGAVSRRPPLDRATTPYAVTVAFGCSASAAPVRPARRALSAPVSAQVRGPGTTSRQARPSPTAVISHHSKSGRTLRRS